MSNKLYKGELVLNEKIDLYPYDENINGFSTFIRFLQSRLDEFEKLYPNHSIELYDDYYYSDDRSICIRVYQLLSETEYQALLTDKAKIKNDISKDRDLKEYKRIKEKYNL